MRIADLPSHVQEKARALLAEREGRGALATPATGEIPPDLLSAGVVACTVAVELARATEPRERMNGTERLYAAQLEVRKRAGEVQRWDFEAEKLRLADATWYTPDFRVVLASGVVEFHEVKGHWTDDARVKIKVAAELHPYPFYAVRRRRAKEGGGFAVQRIAGRIPTP